MQEFLLLTEIIVHPLRLLQLNKPGMTKEAYWEHLAHGPETLCIYMGVKRLPEICELLVRHGKSVDTPVALVHLGTTVSQNSHWNIR